MKMTKRDKTPDDAALGLPCYSLLTWISQARGWGRREGSVAVGSVHQYLSETLAGVVGEKWVVL